MQIASLYEEILSSSRAGKTKKLQTLRKKGIELLSQHSVNRETLREWFDVASAFRYMDEEEQPEVFMEKLGMQRAEFLERMTRLDHAFAELEKLRQQMVTCN